MHLKDKPKFEEALAAMAELYDKSLSPTALELYWSSLKDFEIAQIQRAFGSLAKTARFFPKPVDFIEAMQGQGVSTQDAAMTAWDTFMDGLMKHSSYKSVKFEDKIIMAVVERLDGWHKLIEMLNEEWIWYEKDWLKHYQHYLSSGIPASTPEYLMGILEIQNRNAGYKEAWGQPGVYIGLESPVMITNVRLVTALEHRPAAQQIENTHEQDDMIPITPDLVDELMAQLEGRY